MRFDPTADDRIQHQSKTLKCWWKLSWAAAWLLDLEPYHGQRWNCYWTSESVKISRIAHLLAVGTHVSNQWRGGSGCYKGRGRRHLLLVSLRAQPCFAAWWEIETWTWKLASKYILGFHHMFGLQPMLRSIFLFDFCSCSLPIFILYCGQIKTALTSQYKTHLLVFLCRHHFNQMSEESKVSNATLCVQILKWQSIKSCQDIYDIKITNILIVKRKREVNVDEMKLFRPWHCWR